MKKKILEDLKIDMKFNLRKKEYTKIITPMLISDRYVEYFDKKHSKKIISKLYLKDFDDFLPYESSVSVGEKVGRYFRLNINIRNSEYFLDEKNDISENKYTSDPAPLGLFSCLPDCGFVLVHYSIISFHIHKYGNNKDFSRYKNAILIQFKELIFNILSYTEVYYAYNGNMDLISSKQKETDINTISYILALASSPLLKSIMDIISLEKINISQGISDCLGNIFSVFFGLGIYSVRNPLYNNSEFFASSFGREWSDKSIPLIVNNGKKILLSES